MPRICYKKRQPPFPLAHVVIIEQANEIIGELGAQGYTLTLRQLYYQFVARDLIANKQTEYKRLGSIINDARLAGMIDWYAIEDRTRFLRGNAHMDDPTEILESVPDALSLDRWEGQPHRVEVWIEKDALVGVIERPCRELDVPYFACRGYTSQSEQWRAARRLKRYQDNDQDCVVIHLGDHDPSGIDMTRDMGERFDMFAPAAVEVRRIALNIDQVEAYNPPPNPAKLTDTRAKGYIATYGDESWELDALEPSVIERMIRDVISEYIDEAIWQATADKEAAGRDKLREAIDQIIGDWE